MGVRSCVLYTYGISHCPAGQFPGSPGREKMNLAQKDKALDRDQFAELTPADFAGPSAVPQFFHSYRPGAQPPAPSMPPWPEEIVAAASEELRPLLAFNR